MTRKLRQSLSVTVVADNPETVDGLLAYFGEASVTTHGTRSIDDLATVSETTTAVVLFPDDFAFMDVVAAVTALRRARPRILLVLITREPHLFKLWCEPDGKAVPAVLLPKPSFGWSILDAVRSHAEASVLQT
jgi:hypothetical protein